jgi:hypothetical protein
MLHFRLQQPQFSVFLLARFQANRADVQQKDSEDYQRQTRNAAEAVVIFLVLRNGIDEKVKVVFLISS